MKRFIWALLLLTGFATTSSAQQYGGSWADSLSNAIPSVTQTNAVFQSMPGWNNGNTSYIPQDWRLGVGIQNTEVGALVTQVAPGSAAASVGIKPNDVILTAGSSRVGAFDGRINDVADEIRRSTNLQGQLSLLVYDGATRTIRNVVANMQTNTSNVSVSVALKDRGTLQQGSVLYVSLRNVSNPAFDMPGSTQSIQVSGYGPFTVNFNIDPRYVIPGQTYELNAYVGYYNQYVYALSRPIQISSADISSPRAISLDRWTTAGQNVSVGYPGGYPGSFDNSQQIRDVFVSYLGRQPTNAEIVGWQNYNLDDLRVGILTSPQYRDRFGGNDSSYLSSMFQSLKNRAPSNQELQSLINQLQTSNSPSYVAKQIISQYR